MFKRRLSKFFAAMILLLLLLIMGAVGGMAWQQIPLAEGLWICAVFLVLLTVCTYLATFFQDGEGR